MAYAFNDDKGKYDLDENVLGGATNTLYDAELAIADNAADIAALQDSVGQGIVLSASSNDAFLKDLGAYFVQHMDPDKVFAASVAKRNSWGGFAIGRITNGIVGFLAGASNSTALWYVLYNAGTDTATIKAISFS